MSYLEEAARRLQQIKNTPLSDEQRVKEAITLAALILEEALCLQTPREKAQSAQLARMMQDPKGKVFTTNMTDECFRSLCSQRVASQMIYLLSRFGVPKYLPFIKRAELLAFKWLGNLAPSLFVPLAKWMLRKETSSVILPGEPHALTHHMHKRRREKVRLNINHLGEAILGEEEALSRLRVYVRDLERDDIEYVSIKISTIFSQINLLSWDESMRILAERLRMLYRTAMTHAFIREDGTSSPKFVNLDMEEYRDLHLTKELFKKVLSEEEFLNFSAGIVLQAYLPDSFELQKELTSWARERRGAPIKIRIVKGANLAMEQVEASVRGWPVAPYRTKGEVDANYKRMVTYGCIKENAQVVHLGIASHNLFDIAYALLLRAEMGVENEVSFEMLEGMADHIRRAVQKLTGTILLYCPVATREDFQSAVAYLIRRLDENTGPENFLRHTFGLKPHTPEWEQQASLFSKACAQKDTVSTYPRRTQNRFEHPDPLDFHVSFDNEPDTDFSLPQNHGWAHNIREEWQNRTFEPIPLVIAGKEIHHSSPEGIGISPSSPDKELYRYSLASWEEINDALNSAKRHEQAWSSQSVHNRCHLLSLAAQKMREKRHDLLGVMMADGGKTLLEGDTEVSEAIDFAEYYARSMMKTSFCKDIEWSAKGTILVTPPWNFPISIPAGGILAALVAGNCVLFKPAPEAHLSGWVLVNILWEAGIPKEVLQFISCVDDPIGSKLIADPRVSTVILTGATSTAQLFHKLRPGIDLCAETGGKNALIITAMSDRDLAIKDLVHSAFGHSGQKCSAASLLILEAEVYDDPHFKEQLKDAVSSLKVGTPWNFSSKVVPLIRAPEGALLKGLTELEEGEEWLVKPHVDPHNKHLWSPGVKWGVKENSFMHCTELFGPVLGVMRARDLKHAIRLANGTPYGLTSGIHSLDYREQKRWMQEIEAGNCYINRTITGAIVRRQPFGGCKASSFGGAAKAGGPNYIFQFMTARQVSLPQEQHPAKDPAAKLHSFVRKFSLNADDLGTWFASISSYAFWADHYAEPQDPSKLLGQDNLFGYTPRKDVTLRVQQQDSPFDFLRSLAAASSCNTPLEVSFSRGKTPLPLHDTLCRLFPYFRFVEETEQQFLKRVKEGKMRRVRLLSPCSDALLESASKSACHLVTSPVLANGRFELLHYLREVAFSIDYHRYGNLGEREHEKRSPLL